MVHTQADPSRTELARRDFEKKRKEADAQKQREIAERYGSAAASDAASTGGRARARAHGEARPGDQDEGRDEREVRLVIPPCVNLVRTTYLALVSQLLNHSYPRPFATVTATPRAGAHVRPSKTCQAQLSLRASRTSS